MVPSSSWLGWDNVERSGFHPLYGAWWVSYGSSVQGWIPPGGRSPLSSHILRMVGKLCSYPVRNVLGYFIVMVNGDKDHTLSGWAHMHAYCCSHTLLIPEQGAGRALLKPSPWQAGHANGEERVRICLCSW